MRLAWSMSDCSSARNTMRGDTYRLISVRKANKQERRTWLR
jgi:uncharacterized DUF497 family protein